MLAPVKWLKKYVDIDVPVKELADKMTMTGSKVEEVIDLGKDIKKVVVGKIISIEKHPNADKLVICQVDVGDDTVQIVTGASNVFAGALVPVALHGSTLPNGVSIKRGKLRGVESQGMMCSGQELNLKESDYPGAEVYGILILKDDYKPGTDIKEVLGLNDEVIDFEITPNRPDCLSIIGLAREASLTLNSKFKFPEIYVNENSNDSIDDYIKVKIEDADLCPRYMGRIVKNVKIAPSPCWMQNCLKESGIRPINNVVDVTNYVMLELGQPLHSYDYDLIRNHEIIVRRAKQGEILKTLDHKERMLSSDMIVIADDLRAVGLAGVMGGENSEITPETNTIFFESACFNPQNIRMASKFMAMKTEASNRFEKGLDINGTEYALNRAVQLLQQMTECEVVKGTIDNLNANLNPAKLTVNPVRINQLLGLTLKPEEMIDYLNRLYFKAELDNEGKMNILVPTFRVDIEGTADIAEEVLRAYGYDRIPATLMYGDLMKGEKTDKQKTFDNAKETLTGLGFNEIVTYSFMSPKIFNMMNIPEGDKLRYAVKISNPLGEDQSLMRTMLIPSTLQTLSLNINRKLAEAELFEIGFVFEPKSLPLKELPYEHNHVIMSLYGKNKDFYDLKGAVETFIESFGIQDIEFVRSKNPAFHPGRQAEMKICGEYAGVIGEIHPDVAERFGISNVRVYVSEFDFDNILKNKNINKKYKPLPKYPGMQRDLALLVRDEQEVGEIKKFIESESGKLLESISLFDIYKGKQVNEGYKSVAFSLYFRSGDHTLTDDEVNIVYNKMLKAVQDKYEAKLRE